MNNRLIVSVVVLSLSVGCSSQMDSPPLGVPIDAVTSTEELLLVTGEINSIVENTSVNDDVDIADIETNEPLRALLMETTDDQILMFTYMNDEQDEQSLAYAFTGVVHDLNEYGDKTYQGTLWFINSEGAVPIEVPRYHTWSAEEHFWSIDGSFLLDSQKFIVLELFYATGSSSLVFGIKDGNWHMHNELIYGGDIEVANETTIYIWHSTLDAAFYKEDSYPMGRTMKPYYLYWDNGFKEYGGIHITESQLLSFDGATAILDGIRAGGNDVRQIIYRTNGIININYGWEDDSTKLNEYITLKYDEDSVVIDEQFICDGGYYHTALIDDIAVYPEFMPPIKYEP